MEDNTMIIRASRASQTREKETSKPKVWTPPSSLDAPPAPTGFRHRWIRSESLGFQDSKNISGRLRSGYELVRADEYPDTDLSSSRRRQIQGSDRSWWPCAGKGTGRDR